MKLTFISVFLVFFLAFCANEQPISVNGEIVQDKGNLKIIKLWGTHQERGFAYGYLIGEEILSAQNDYIKPLFGGLYKEAKMLLKDSLSFTIPNKYKIEAQGIIEGMKAKGVITTNFDKWDILLSNSFLDIMGFRYMLSQGKHGCSSLISWGEATNGTDLNGNSVISRHVDWSADKTLINNNVVVIHIPSEEDEQPWALIGFAGQMSVLSGVNEQGVGAFQHMVFTSSSTSKMAKQYEPIWFTLRDGIELRDYNQDGNSNVLDIKSALKFNKNGYADSFIISAIANTKESETAALVAEVDPQVPYYSFRSNEYDDFISGDNLYTANSEFKQAEKRTVCSRYSSAALAINGSKNIDSKRNWEIMQQHSNCEELGFDNVQFMQFIPFKLSLKLAVYENGKHAFQNQPIIIDLKSLFEN